VLIAIRNLVAPLHAASRIKCGSLARHVSLSETRVGRSCARSGTADLARAVQTAE
jgi:hypothetical protein